jgi:hypothetical protein
MPHFYALLFMMVLQMCNISVVYFLLTIFNIISSEVIIGRFEFMAIGFGYFGLNYLFLVYHGRHKKYVSRFEKESKIEKSRKDFWFNLYIFISVFTFIGIFIYAFIKIKFG